MLRSVTTNTLYQLLGRLASIFLGLFITYLLTHHLSSQDYGRYTIISNLIIQIASFTDWGTGFIAVRTASQHHYSSSEIFSNLLYFRLFTSLIGLTIFLILSTFNTFDLTPQLYLAACLVLIPLSIKNVFQALFQSQLKLKYTSFIEILSNVLYVLFLYFMLSRPYLTVHVVYSLALATAIGTAVAATIATRQTAFSAKLNPKLILYLLKEALPMGGQLIIFNIYNRLDTYYLKYFHTETQVAIYGLAYRLYDNLILVAAYLMNSLYPIISSTNTKQTSKIFSTTFHVLLMAALGVSTIMFFAAPFIIYLINPEYAPSITPFRILSLSLVFTYLNHLTGYTLAGIGKQRAFFYIALIALTSNALLNILLIPQYSYYAAAWTTLATESLVCTLSLVYLHRTQKLSPHINHLHQTVKLISHKLPQIITKQTQQ